MQSLKWLLNFWLQFRAKPRKWPRLSFRRFLREIAESDGWERKKDIQFLVYIGLNDNSSLRKINRKLKFSVWKSRSSWASKSEWGLFSLKLQSFIWNMKIEFVAVLRKMGTPLGPGHGSDRLCKRTKERERERLSLVGNQFYWSDWFCG